MTVQNSIAAHATATSELGQISQLYAVLSVVEQIVPPGADMVGIPDEAALYHAFDKTSGIAKVGFLSVARETVIAATAGATALLGKGSHASAAAEELARYLHQRISLLGKFVGL